MIDEEHRASYWHQTVRLMGILMILVGSAALLLPLFTDALNLLPPIFGFPWGFYLCAQGAVFLGIFAVFWYASRQETIDRRSGAVEDL